MLSLQSALVYKYTITFRAELAGLPWVQAGEARQVLSSIPVLDKPFFQSSAAANPPSSSAFATPCAGKTQAHLPVQLPEMPPW